MDATGLLAPVLVLATVVERVMEVLWSTWERLTVAAWETMIRKGNDQAEKDKLLRDPDYVRKLLLDNAAYKDRKRLMTLLVGSLLGLVLSGLTGVRFFEMTFAMLQLAQPVVRLGTLDLALAVDLLLTGLIIGAGSQPAHSIINWIYWAQNVQKELADLRRGERTLADSQLLKNAFAVLGVPPETMLEVMKLMEQHGVTTLDDLINLLRSPAMAAHPQELAAAESLQAMKSYLRMTGQGNLARLLP